MWVARRIVVPLILAVGLSVLLSAYGPSASMARSTATSVGTPTRASLSVLKRTQPHLRTFPKADELSLSSPYSIGHCQAYSG